MPFNRNFTDSDRAVIRLKLGELCDGLEDMDDTDVCGVLSGMLCYAVFKSGGTLDDAVQVVRNTWPALKKRGLPS